MEQTKVCTKCGVEKEINCFTKQKGGKDGIRSYCKECASISIKAYRSENKDIVNKKKKQWADLNKDKMKGYMKTYRKMYRKNNSKRLAEKNKEWELKNPEKHKEIRLKIYKNYNEKNRERIKLRLSKKNSEYVRQLKEPYIKGLLKGKGFTDAQIYSNPELLEIQKLNLKIKRYVKSKQQNSQ